MINTGLLVGVYQLNCNMVYAIIPAMGNLRDNEKENNSLGEDSRAKARENRRRVQRMAARRNRIVLFLVSFLLILAAVGAAGYFMWDNLLPVPESTLLTLKSNGSITFDEVNSLSGEYDGSKLKDFAKNQVEEFNSGSKKKVELKRVKVKEGQAYVCTEFPDFQTYRDFTGYETFYGTVKEAKKAGYDISDQGEYTPKDSDNVFVIRQAVSVALPKDVLYISSQWASISKENDRIVNILPINDNPDAPPLVYIVLGKKADSGDVTVNSSKGE